MGSVLALSRHRGTNDGVSAKIQYGRARTLTSGATRGHSVSNPARSPRMATWPVLLIMVSAVIAGAVLAAIPREVPHAAVMAVFGLAWLGIALSVVLPARSDMARSEISRRLGRFRDALNSAGDQPVREVLLGLLALSAELGLEEHDIREELGRIRASLSALDLRDRLAHGDLPVVAGATPLPSDDICHLICPVRFGRRRSDQFGHLLLTSGWLRFRGALDLSVAWTEVSSVDRAGCDIIVHLQDSARALRFGCHTLEESMCGAVFAEHLARLAHRSDSARHPCHAAPAMRDDANPAGGVVHRLLNHGQLRS